GQRIIEATAHYIYCLKSGLEENNPIGGIDKYRSCLVDLFHNGKMCQPIGCYFRFCTHQE
ncbi:hypothetical protein, partial [Coleofasciculus chthonoplastes]|uniref:hypothetical protein n=1 Tax=Coleofasciculus chthonoplastes TaxID=64178 RepID=UPI0032F58DD2